MKLYSCSHCKSINAFSNMFTCSCCGKRVCSSCAKLSGGVCSNCYDVLYSSQHSNIGFKKTDIS